MDPLSLHGAGSLLRLRQGFGGQVGEQSRVAPALIPAFSQGAKEKDGGVGLVGRLRAAIRRLNPAIPFRTLATLRVTLLPKLLSGELSVVEAVLPDRL